MAQNQPSRRKSHHPELGLFNRHGRTSSFIPKRSKGDEERFAESISRCCGLIANEPTIGLHFVQEHLHTVVPGMVSIQESLLETARKAQHSIFDAEMALMSMKAFEEEPFANSAEKWSTFVSLL